MHIDFRLDPKRHLHVLFVGDGNVNILDQFRHHFDSGLPPLPKILAVVQIAGDGDSLLPCLLHCFKRQVGSRTADGRRNTRDVEPARIFQGSVPADVARLGQSDGTMIAIVDDLRSPLVGAGLKIIDTQPALAAHDSGSIHAEPAQFANYSVRHGVLVRQHRNEGRWQAQLRHRDSHVGLTSSKRRHELRCL